MEKVEKKREEGRVGAMCQRGEKRDNEGEFIELEKRSLCKGTGRHLCVGLCHTGPRKSHEFWACVC